MSDYDLPDLPSDEELGITEEDLQALEEEEKGSRGGVGAPPAAPPGTGERGPDGPDRDAPPPSGAVAPPPGGGFRGPLTLLVLVALVVVSSQWWALPSTVPANAPDTAFSSARAMTRVVELARRPHPPGSPEHERVRRVLQDELRSLGLEPEVQTTTSMLRRGPLLRTATVRNVVARIPGTDPTGTLLLAAHYDSRPLTPGAADDAVGVATVLETVRALLAGAPPRNDVVVLLTDAEELGLLGMRAFLAEHPLADEVDVALNVEMRGGGGASILFETGAENGWIMREYVRRAAAPFATSLGYEVYRRMPNDTDFTPLKEAGVQGLNFAGIGRAHAYHQAWDTPENVSERTLQHHGLQMSSMARALADAELSTLEAPSLVFFPLPFVGTVAYGEVVGWGLAAALVLLLVLAVFVARRRRSGWGGVLTGIVLSVVLGGAGWVLGALLSGWLATFHPEAGRLSGSRFHVEGWYLLALASFVLSLATASLAVLRRRAAAGGLVAGALVLPTVAALVLTFLAPMAAMVVQWPVLAGLLGALVLSGVGPRERMGWFGWVAALLLAAPVLALLVPPLELGWLALTFGSASLLGVVVAVTLLALLPALDALREPNGWWAPLLTAVLGVVLLGVGIFLSDSSVDRPLPTTLAYALDREGAEATWLTDELDDRSVPQADPGRVWARERAGGEFAGAWERSWFLEGARAYAAAPAPAVEAPEPRVAVVTDSLTPTGRRVGLAVRSGVDAELVVVGFPPGVELWSVNGHPVPERTGAEPVGRMSHWGEPQAGLRLELAVPADLATLRLDLVEHLFRPGELLGDAPWHRDPGMAPDVSRGSDRAMIRTPLVVALEGGTAGPGPLVQPEGFPAGPDSASVAPDSTAALPGSTPELPDSASAGAGPGAASAPLGGA